MSMFCNASCVYLRFAIVLILCEYAAISKFNNLLIALSKFKYTFSALLLQHLDWAQAAEWRRGKRR